MALASCICALVSPLLFTIFVTVGALQEGGYDIPFESHRYQSILRIFMLVLSGLAVFLAHRAEFQIAISGGVDRGVRLASIGRIVGFGWGAAILLAILLWPV